jgi:tetratricopeptide (TPR) repeat protein
VLIVINYQWLWLLLAVVTMFIAAMRFRTYEHFHYAFAIIVLALFFALVSTRLPAFAPGLVETHAGVRATLTATEGVLHGWRSLFGSGPATFSFTASLYPSPPPDQGHDFIMTLLATNGIVGLILFLTLVVSALGPFFELSAFDTDLAASVAGSTFLIVSLFFFQAFFVGLIIVFLLLGVEAGEVSRREVSFSAVPRPWTLVVAIGTMVFAALALVGIYLIGEQYIAEVFYARSNSAVAAGRLDDAFHDVSTAIMLARRDVYMRAASQILIAEARRLAAVGDISNATGLPSVIASAVQTAQGAVAQNPLDAGNWSNLGSVYETVLPIVSGADQLAEESYQKASVLDPANPLWDLSAARVYIEAADLLSQGDPSSTVMRKTAWTNAQALLEQSIGIDDGYAPARVLLAELFLKEGDMGQAIEKVQELRQQNPLDPGIAFELGYLYYQSNQMDQAQEEFQMAVLLDPNYANARYFLGLVYEGRGMTDQALDQFERLAALNPGNTQIASIVASLKAGEAPPASATSSTLSGGLSGNEIMVPQKPSTKSGKTGVK